MRQWIAQACAENWVIGDLLLGIPCDLFDRLGYRRPGVKCVCACFAVVVIEAKHLRSGKVRRCGSCATARRRLGGKPARS